jgi:hypothetical protein
MMALIAATAVGFALVRWFQTQPRMVNGISYNAYGVSNWVDWLWSREPSCFIVAITLTLIPLRWLRPRPHASRVIQQPGAVACLAVACGMVAGLVKAVVEHAIHTDSYAPGVRAVSYANSWYWMTAIWAIPLAVIGAWTALAISGRWSPERSWIDRLGRILGVFWLSGHSLAYLRNLWDIWLPYKQ